MSNSEQFAELGGSCPTTEKQRLQLELRLFINGRPSKHCCTRRSCPRWGPEVEESWKWRSRPSSSLALPGCNYNSRSFFCSASKDEAEAASFDADFETRNKRFRMEAPRLSTALPLAVRKLRSGPIVSRKLTWEILCVSMEAAGRKRS